MRRCRAQAGCRTLRLGPAMSLALYIAPIMLLLGPATAAAPACGPRLALTFNEGQEESVLQRVLDMGFKVHASGPGFAAVSRCGTGAAAASGSGVAAKDSGGLLGTAMGGMQRRRHLRELSSLEGIASVEPDMMRYLHRPEPSASGKRQQQEQQQQKAGLSGSLSRLVRRVLRTVGAASDAGTHWPGAARGPPGTAYTSWELDQTSCSLKDKATAGYAGAEVVPWGIPAVQADSRMVPARTAGTGVTVCIIDSGVWAEHPDLKDNDLSGCGVAAGKNKERSSSSAVAACPFAWDKDIVAHGTHVAGTIAARQNGRGVVGVIPDGADIFSVRIWDTTGDVSQGQGLYASDLVRAYAACEARLEELKASNPGKKQRMVVSMSFGSAGPLTVERMWFDRASRRGDMLFVASSGNNGSDWTSFFTPANGAQWKSYPASYNIPPLLSVANANCQGGIADTSQRNEAVAIAAPGTSVLSSVPATYRYVRGALTTDRPTPKDRYPEPRPIQDAGLATTGGLKPLVDCPAGNSVDSGTHFAPCKAAAGGNVCLFGLPGSRDIYEEACSAMVACMDGGGSALVAYRGQDVEDMKSQLGAPARSAPVRPNGDDGGNGGPDSGSGVGPGGGGWGSGGGRDGDEREILPGARLNCGTRCACWGELQKRAKATGGSIPPAVFIGKRQAYDLLSAIKSGAAPKGNVTVFNYPYRHYDGTSMAAPHVAGGAARVWVDFPGCSAGEVAKAIKDSAKPLNGVNAVTAGHGMLQIEEAYKKLKTFPCASGGGR